MSKFLVTGGLRLKGELIPQGAKNEALQVICASLLTPEKVTISNIPEILDVKRLIDLVKGLGVEVERLDKGVYSFEAANIDLAYMYTPEFSRAASGLRGSIMVLGPLLARFGVGVVPRPGGDKIGRRRLDTHLLGIERLGGTFTCNEETGFFKVESSKLKGCYMLLEEASVTGTANIVMAAVMAEGTTTIYNAACEPYIQQLCQMLNSMGARISGIGSNLLTVEGVERLGGCEHRCLPDMKLYRPCCNDSFRTDHKECLCTAIGDNPRGFSEIRYTYGNNGR